MKNIKTKAELRVPPYLVTLGVILGVVILGVPSTSFAPAVDAETQTVITGRIRAVDSAVSSPSSSVPILEIDPESGSEASSHSSLSGSVEDIDPFTKLSYTYLYRLLPSPEERFVRWADKTFLGLRQENAVVFRSADNYIRDRADKFQVLITNESNNTTREVGFSRLDIKQLLEDNFLNNQIVSVSSSQYSILLGKLAWPPSKKNVFTFIINEDGSPCFSEVVSQVRFYVSEYGFICIGDDCAHTVAHICSIDTYVNISDGYESFGDYEPHDNLGHLSINDIMYKFFSHEASDTIRFDFLSPIDSTSFKQIRPYIKAYIEGPYVTRDSDFKPLIFSFPACVVDAILEELNEKKINTIGDLVDSMSQHIEDPIIAWNLDESELESHGPDGELRGPSDRTGFVIERSIRLRQLGMSLRPYGDVF